MSERVGSLTMIIGSMMSSKTSHIIQQIRRYRSIGMTTMVINHSSDVRFGRNQVITHDGAALPCHMVDRLTPLLGSRDYQIADVIAIEELQFFDVNDALHFCKRAADVDGKHVILAALQGDRHRQSWPTVSEMIPLADVIQHLTGFCALCRDGTRGSFTKRTTPEVPDQNFVGDSRDYACMCRLHYHTDMLAPT